MKLRVLTLNVWNNQGDARRNAVINRELRQLAPDLVAFQEVMAPPDSRQLEQLLAGTNLHGTHQSQLTATLVPYVDRFGGNAVATRWPHRIVETLDLRGADAPDVPWHTLAAMVSLPEAGDVLFVGTTTSWRLDAEAARERQVVAVTELDARHRQKLPTIIAGDFSASPDAACIRYLGGLQSLGGHSVHYHDAWPVAGQGPGYTWISDNPNARGVMDQIVQQPNHRRRIDYVFLGSTRAHPDAHAHVRAASLAFDQPIDGVWCSDHFGVVLDLEIGKNG